MTTKIIVVQDDSNFKCEVVISSINNDGTVTGTKVEPLEPKVSKEIWIHSNQNLTVQEVKV